MTVVPGLQVLKCDKAENIIENEIPHKRASIGSVALTTDKILLFGGISEQ